MFTDIDIPLEYYQETIRRQSVVNEGVRFILKDQITANTFDTYEYIYENGITDYVKEFVGEAETLSDVQFWQTERKGRDRADKPEYKVKINAALCFSNKKQLKEYYHNSSFLEHGGAPEKAVRSAFVSQIDAYLKANGKYLKTDSKVNFQDIEDCLVLVVSSFSTQTSYENQTKKAITNKFIQEAMTEFFRHQLEVYFLENPLDGEKVANQVLINMRSRIKAETTRLNIKKTLQSGNDLSNRVEKFVDCRSKDVNEREIFIVEGDSALGACKQARDSAFQAIIPVRGKILNCLKAEYNKIFKSEIITDLIKVLGCGVEVTGKASKELSSFNLDNLRWSKVIINTKDETWFCYTEKEKQEALAEIGDRKFTIQRSKGLGENEADMMWLTTMNPKTRRLIKVEPDYSPEAVADKFDLLLGDNLQGRKDHIAENGYLYLDLTDVS